MLMPRSPKMLARGDQVALHHVDLPEAVQRVFEVGIRFDAPPGLIQISQFEGDMAEIEDDTRIGLLPQSLLDGSRPSIEISRPSHIGKLARVVSHAIEHPAYLDRIRRHLGVDGQCALVEFLCRV